MHARAPGVKEMVKLYVFPGEAGHGRAVHPGMLKPSILAFGGGSLTDKERERGYGWRVKRINFAAYGTTYRTAHREFCKQHPSLDRGPLRGGSPSENDRRTPLQQSTPTPQGEKRGAWSSLVRDLLSISHGWSTNIYDDRISRSPGQPLRLRDVMTLTELSKFTTVQFKMDREHFN